MNKYVVGFISFSDNELSLEIVEADGEFDAAYKYLSENTLWELDSDISQLDELQDFLFDGDCMINVIRID